MTTQAPATIEALYHVPENAKAEIINGELVLMPPTGGGPGLAGDTIFVSLWQHAARTGRGRAVGDNKGFRVDLPNRTTFSPDAGLYVGPDPGMRFYEGAPIFAVEVRSENDYGPQAEVAMADKRADYFAAGTLVVWDVDLQAEVAMADKRADYFAAGTLVVWDVDLLSQDVIKVYRATNPQTPDVFRCGQSADAEPAVPGWTFVVDNLFG